MKKKITVLLLTTVMILSLTACGGSNKPVKSTTTSTTASTEEITETTTTQDTATTEAATTKTKSDEIPISGKCEKKYEILTHPHDAEYFCSATGNWIWLSENKFSTVGEIMSSDGVVEVQELLSYTDDGECCAGIIKVVYSTNEAAQGAHELFLQDIENSESVYKVWGDSIVCDNVVYAEELSYPRNMSRELAHIYNDGSLEKYGEGLYADVMGGGAIWTKYITFEFDGVIYDDGEAPSLPIVASGTANGTVTENETIPDTTTAGMDGSVTNVGVGSDYSDMCGLFTANQNAKITINTLVSYIDEFDNFQFQLCNAEPGFVESNWYCTCTSAELLSGPVTMQSWEYTESNGEMVANEMGEFTMRWNGSGYDYIYGDTAGVLSRNQ